MVQTSWVGHCVVGQRALFFLCLVTASQWFHRSRLACDLLPAPGKMQTVRYMYTASKCTRWVHQHWKCAETLWTAPLLASLCLNCCTGFYHAHFSVSSGIWASPLPQSHHSQVHDSCSSDSLSHQPANIKRQNSHGQNVSKNFSSRESI